MGASKKEQSSLLPLYMCRSRIGPFPPLPPGPLIQSYLPHPLNWRMYIVACITPLLCWLFYPHQFATLHPYHTTLQCCSSFSFGLPFGVRISYFYIPPVTIWIFIVVSKIPLHGVRVHWSPFSPRVSSQYLAHSWTPSILSVLLVLHPNEFWFSQRWLNSML